jgi:hypothetical protein
MATKTPTRTHAPSVKTPVVPEEVVKKVEAAVETPFDAFMEHQRVALRETSNALRALLPKEVQEHTRTAYKEAVEGYRGLFNSVIDEIVENIEKIKLPNAPKN